MNNGLRNTLTGGLITVVLTFLEVQMDTYVKAQQKTDTDMDKMMDKLTDIQNKVTRLNTEFEIEHGNHNNSK